MPNLSSPGPSEPGDPAIPYQPSAPDPVNHRPSAAHDAEALAGYWNSRSPEFDGIHPRLQLIGELVASIPGIATMLDVGCGPAAVRRVIPSTIEYFGVDIASDVIAAQHDPEHFEVIDLDGDARCFGERRFDLILCSGVFEYIQRTQPFMQFLRRKSAPDGHLIFSFTNHQHHKDGLHWLLGNYSGYKDPHVNFMLVPEVQRLLAQSGWEVLRYRAITRSGDVHPRLGRFTHFPLNVFNRQYVFVCRRTQPRGLPAR